MDIRTSDVEDLRAMRALIAQGWTKRYYAVRELRPGEQPGDEIVFGSDPQAIAWGVDGALLRIIGPETLQADPENHKARKRRYWRIRNALEKATGIPDVSFYAHEKGLGSQAEALAWIDVTIAQLGGIGPAEALGEDAELSLDEALALDARLRAERKAEYAQAAMG